MFYLYICNIFNTFVYEFNKEHINNLIQNTL